MKITQIDIDQLIQAYMQYTTGTCIAIYINPKVQAYFANENTKVKLYTLCVLRFKTHNEAIIRYNDLVRLNATLWIDGTRS